MSATSGAAAVIAQENDRDAFATFATVRVKMRAEDESHRWPICNKFNATDRAIRRLNKAQADGLVIESPLEYYAALDAEISRIVNDPNL
jgi:hypothetical protein|tara:strand:- start:101 stop:367 length:267 start_codon:yes stop_codon:yes gene_type:complete